MVDHTELSSEAVLELTGGNPLFVTEVVASGVDLVPSSVQDSVLARASKLTSEARRVLELVSVVPTQASCPLVEEILHPTQGQVAESYARIFWSTRATRCPSATSWPVEPSSPH